MLKQINGVTLKVKDLQVSEQFYTGILAMPLVSRTENSVVVEISGGCRIELVGGGETPAIRQQDEAGYEHLCIEVFDAHEVADHIKSKGVTLHREVNQGLDLNYQCWVIDPDGYRIEFMQMHPQSLQYTSKAK
ncbi:MAG: VOC family protein [Acetanaerobacterium sp.]